MISYMFCPICNAQTQHTTAGCVRHLFHPTPEAAMSEVKRWVAWFSDFRDLTIGTLYEKSKAPEALLGTNSQFEAVNAMHYDHAMSELTKARERIRELEMFARCYEAERASLLADNHQIRKELEAEVEKHTKFRRYSIEETESGIRVCSGDHERSADCEWTEYVFKDKADRMRAALEKIADPRKRDHSEPDYQTKYYCVQNIAIEALSTEEAEK